MKVVSVDQGNCHARILERLCAAQAAESRADDNHSRPIPRNQFASTRSRKEASLPSLRQIVDRSRVMAEQAVVIGEIVDLREKLLGENMLAEKRST